MSTQIAGTFVEPRGMIRSVVAATAGRELGGLVGAVAARTAATPPDASPLRKGQIAHLGVFADRVVLAHAKRGAFKPKATTDAIADAARADVTDATLEKGRLAGVLTVGFADGSSWTFDVPKVHLSGARAIVDALT